MIQINIIKIIKIEVINTKKILNKKKEKEMIIMINHIKFYRKKILLKMKIKSFKKIKLKFNKIKFY